MIFVIIDEKGIISIMLFLFMENVVANQKNIWYNKNEYRT